MNREMVYEWIEEADSRENMEILDAAVNRFRELHADWELVLSTLPKGPQRNAQLEKIIKMLQQESGISPNAATK